MLFRVNILTLILFRIFSENKTAKIQNSVNYKTVSTTKQCQLQNSANYKTAKNKTTKKTNDTIRCFAVGAVWFSLFSLTLLVTGPLNKKLFLRLP